jgi:Phage capsid protein
MAVQAAVTLYREELVSLFETKRSKLSMAATKESMMHGQSAVFLVSGSDGGRAVTRGTNGDIPYGSPSNTQVTATLQEFHAPHALTGFDIFASQGNQTQALKDASLAKINREIDYNILAGLSSATADWSGGTAVIVDLDVVLGSRAVLGNNSVPTEEADNMFCVISPAAEAYLMQTSEFTNADYVDVKPFAGAASAQFRRWANCNWIVSNLVDGVGTSSETLYMFHRAALGYAANMGMDTVAAGYDDKQAQSWSRATVYQATKILQDSGIVKITHDGSAFTTS